MPAPGNWQSGPRVEVDTEGNAVRVVLADRPISRTRRVKADVSIDYDEQGKPVSVVVAFARGMRG